MVLFERRVHPLIGALVALTLLTSIAAALDPSLYLRLALVPDRVFHGELWRLVTWTLVEPGPLSLIFACITIFWFGGDLLDGWGQRRFTRFVAGIVVGAAVGTSLAALALGATRYPYLGGWALGDALVIAWALQFPDRRVRLYQLLVLGGPQLAHVTLGVTALFAVFYGVRPFLPALLAGGGAYLYMTGRFPTWRRRRPLRSVPRDPGPRWVN